MMSRNTSCGCSTSREQLLRQINESSFAVNDILLFLDTHPKDQEALEYFSKAVAARKTAMKQYAQAYGPLTIDTADDNASRSWQWIEQPFPWE